MPIKTNNWPHGSLGGVDETFNKDGAQEANFSLLSIDSSKFEQEIRQVLVSDCLTEVCRIRNIMPFSNRKRLKNLSRMRRLLLSMNRKGWVLEANRFQQSSVNFSKEMEYQMPIRVTREKKSTNVISGISLNRFSLLIDSVLLISFWLLRSLAKCLSRSHKELRALILQNPGKVWTLPKSEDSSTRRRNNCIDPDADIVKAVALSLQESNHERASQADDPCCTLYQMSNQVAEDVNKNSRNEKNFGRNSENPVAEPILEQKSVESDSAKKDAVLRFPMHDRSVEDSICTRVAIMKSVDIPHGELYEVIQFGVIPNSRYSGQLFVCLKHAKQPPQAQRIEQPNRSDRAELGKKYFLPSTIKTAIKDYADTRNICIGDLKGWSLMRTSSGMVKGYPHSSSTRWRHEPPLLLTDTCGFEIRNDLTTKATLETMKNSKNLIDSEASIDFAEHKSSQNDLDIGIEAAVEKVVRVVAFGGKLGRQTDNNGDGNDNDRDKHRQATAQNWAQCDQCQKWRRLGQQQVHPTPRAALSCQHPHHCGYNHHQPPLLIANHCLPQPSEREPSHHRQSIVLRLEKRR